MYKSWINGFAHHQQNEKQLRKVIFCLCFSPFHQCRCSPSRWSRAQQRRAPDSCRSEAGPGLPEHTLFNKSSDNLICPSMCPKCDEGWSTYAWRPTVHRSLCSQWSTRCPSHSPSTGLTNTTSPWSSSCRLCRLHRRLSSSPWRACSSRTASRK